jgi:hypothetical protein
MSVPQSIRTEQVGNSTVRLLKTQDGYAGVVLHPQGGRASFEGDDPDALWRRMLGEVGRAHPDYFGFEGAKARFLRYAPLGFDDPAYLADERDYKVKAVSRVSTILPLERARSPSPDDCTNSVRAFQATNLVFPVEKARIKEVLQSAQGPAFLSSAASFADGDLASGLAGMVRAIAPSAKPSWPMLTYLPFLWAPDRHIFLKPAVTCDFADRVGHPFSRAYQEGVTAPVYQSLLDLAAETGRQIADLAPKDLIDIQSFIWVVGAYTEAEIDAGGARPR